MTQPAIYYKPSPVKLEDFNLGALGKEVDEVISRLEDKHIFSEDLMYIQNNGIRQVQLAILFNTTTRTIRRWNCGKHKPTKLSYILIIRRLAKCIREKEKAQREAVLKPQVVRY